MTIDKPLNPGNSSLVLTSLVGQHCLQQRPDDDGLTPRSAGDRRLGLESD